MKRCDTPACVFPVEQKRTSLCNRCLSELRQQESMSGSTLSPVFMADVPRRAKTHSFAQE